MLSSAFARRLLRLPGANVRTRRFVPRTFVRHVLLAVLGCVLGECGTLPNARIVAGEVSVQPAVQIRVDEGHPWRPPFGLQRIGRPLLVTVEVAGPPEPATEYTLVARRDGQALSRSVLQLTNQSPATCQVAARALADRSWWCWPSRHRERRWSWRASRVRAASVRSGRRGRPDQVIHPVDLGCILVPSDWLVLRGDQTGRIEGMAMCRTRDVPARA